MINALTYDDNDKAQLLTENNPSIQHRFSLCAQKKMRVIIIDVEHEAIKDHMMVQNMMEYPKIMFNDITSGRYYYSTLSTIYKNKTDENIWDLITLTVDLTNSIDENILPDNNIQEDTPSDENILPDNNIQEDTSVDNTDNENTVKIYGVQNLFELQITKGIVRVKKIENAIQYY